MFNSMDEPYYTKDFDMKYGKGAYMKYLDERSFVIFAQNGGVIYQQTMANGGINTVELYNRISFLGNNVKCMDAIPYGHNE